jgi:hypothetical protein
MGQEADQGSRAVGTDMRPVHRSDRCIRSVCGAWLVSKCYTVLLGV